MGDGQGRKDINILKDSTTQPILSQVNSSSSNLIDEVCTYSLEIPWTDDSGIRKEMDDLYCLFAYSSNLEPCRTDAIQVTFSGTGIIKSNVYCVFVPCDDIHLVYSMHVYLSFDPAY